MTRILLAAASGLALTACASDGADMDTDEAMKAAPAEEAVTVSSYDDITTLDQATSGPSEVAMWRTGDEDTTVYMIGTVHLLRPSVEWKTDDYERAFAEADAVYIESDSLSEEAQAKAAELLPRYAFNPPGTTLASYFTEEEVAEVNAAMAPMGITVEQLAPMRPWFAGIMVAQTAMMSMGASPEPGLEMMIVADATEAGKPVRFLEGLEEVFGILASVDDEIQADILVDGAEDFQNMEAEMSRLVAAWYDGDADTVAGMMTEAYGDYPEAEDALLARRNANWTGRLKEVIDTEPGTFLVAVGAGHLAGDDSLQEMLQAEGYAVERLDTATGGF